jgi:tRNA threonylcarbamoyladenosine biosynthesis protein TsaB
MLVLGIDTCLGSFGIALMRGDELLDAYLHAQLNMQAELMIPSVLQLLEKNKLSFSDVTHIAINIGPGSFTGIRIGLSAVQGIVFAAPHIKLVPITTFEIYAVHPPADRFKVVIEAGRGQAYSQEFKSGVPLGDAEIENVDELLDYGQALIGNCAGCSDKYSPQDICSSAIKKIRAGGVWNQKISPLYIRLPDVKL